MSDLLEIMRASRQEDSRTMSVLVGGTQEEFMQAGKLMLDFLWGSASKTDRIPKKIEITVDCAND